MTQYLKYSLLFLFGVLITFSILLWRENNSLNTQIDNHEFTISTYVKVIEAFGRLGEVDIKALKHELSDDFEVSGSYESSDQNKVYHTIIVKDFDDGRPKSIGNFMGGAEIVTDTTDQIETIILYKP